MAEGCKIFSITFREHMLKYFYGNKFYRTDYFMSLFTNITYRRANPVIKESENEDDRN